MQQRRVCPLFPTFVFGEHIETNGGRSEDEIASAISEAQCNFSGR
jgi:predicted DsbA family dithiol-disulfide isomerase